MCNTSPRRQGYPSDLSDSQWRSIAPLIPPEPDRGRRRSTDVREIVNGINYRWATGCVWRMLPHDLPPWGTVYTYFRRWQSDGTLSELRDALLAGRKARRETDRPARQNPFGERRKRAVSDGAPSRQRELPYASGQRNTPSGI